MYIHSAFYHTKLDKKLPIVQDDQTLAEVRAQHRYVDGIAPLFQDEKVHQCYLVLDYTNKERLV